MTETPPATYEQRSQIWERAEHIAEVSSRKIIDPEEEGGINELKRLLREESIVYPASLTVQNNYDTAKAEYERLKGVILRVEKCIEGMPEDSDIRKGIVSQIESISNVIRENP